MCDPVPPSAPLWVLQPATLDLLSVQLAREKLLPAPGGHLRDWRGVAELAGLAQDHNTYQKICNSQNRFMELFSVWKKQPEANVSHLWEILAQIDRFDARDDVADKMFEDIKVASENATKKGLELSKLQVPNAETEEALTMDDLDCIASGKPLPVYDAFILYGEEDADTIGEIVQQLEAQGLRILIKERDLLGGTFEHAAVMKLVSSRCNKLVPFFSKSFFSSVYNKFLVDFAQHHNLEANQRIGGKIIPIVGEQRCEIPANLSIYSKLRYDPNSKVFNFWEKLAKTINPSINYNPSLFPKEPSAGAEGKIRPAGPVEKFDVNSKASDNITEIKQKLKPSKQVNSVINTKPASNKKSNKRKESKKQVFSNILLKSDQSSSEPSSLESEMETGDSGALLLPEVPTHEPGGIAAWVKNVKSKLAGADRKSKDRKLKDKYKAAEASSSAC